MWEKSSKLDGVSSKSVYLIFFNIVFMNIYRYIYLSIPLTYQTNGFEFEIMIIIYNAEI